MPFSKPALSAKLFFASPLFVGLPVAGSLTLALLCSLLCSLGCKPAPEVETYSVERTSPLQISPSAEEIQQHFDHILVAIVPQGEQAWFFKLVGKASVIKRQRAAFLDFLATVKPTSKPGDTPSWDLPEGWSTSDKVVRFRSATIVVPDADGELEIAVSSLALNTKWEDFLTLNVNRWVGQLQRQPLSQEVVLKLATKTPTQSGQATVLELSGIMRERPMGPMTMGGNDPHAGLDIAAPSTSSKAPPANKNPQASAPPQKKAPKQNGPLEYKTPEGWAPGRKSSMRKAAFLLPGGGPKDEVTVMDFSADPKLQMRDVAPNVIRWAREAQISSLTDEAAKKLAKPITIAGIKGHYVELTSPADAPTQRAVHAAMIIRGDLVWFFKMSGKPEIVNGQRETFRSFLDSVNFK